MRNLKVSHTIEQLLSLSLVFGAFEGPFFLLLGPFLFSLPLLLLQVGKGLADFHAGTEAAYRRVSYLSQVAQAEALRTVVDGGRFGVAAGSVDGLAGKFDRPWGYLFWQLNDLTQGLSWGSLEYPMRFKLLHYRANDLTLGICFYLFIL